MKLKLVLTIPIFSTGALLGTNANASPLRKLIIRSFDQDEKGQLKLRVAALETHNNQTYAISNLDKGAFQFEWNGKIQENLNFDVSTFEKNTANYKRAIVWAYDATGVGTIKSLNKELRTLSAKNFSNFNADFLSILGKSSRRTIERIAYDPSTQRDIASLQKTLESDPTENNISSSYTESLLCVANKKFNQWTSTGLKKKDQKILILMGGSLKSPALEQTQNDSCARSLTEMGVTMYQIIFAKPENLEKRLWTSRPEALNLGTVFRVLEIPSAIKTLQTIQDALNFEYVFKIPSIEKNNFNPSIQKKKLKIISFNQGIFFASIEHDFEYLYPMQSQTALHSPKQSPPPIQFPKSRDPLNQKLSLALNAWLEWLLTSIVIGGIVTFLHHKRMANGVIILSHSTSRPFLSISAKKLEQLQIFLNAFNPSHSEQSVAPRLLVLNGKEKGREYQMTQNSVTFGRSFICDLRLKGKHIRRKHGRLSFQGEKALLEDFSHGQLSVNGRPLHHLRVIGHGAVIQLGDLQLLFRCGAP